jgi:hypothetical protein
MSREDSPGWQKPQSQPFAGVGEDTESVKVNRWSRCTSATVKSAPFSGSLGDVRLFKRALS